ncbi:hypothetical protein AURDEDRAFT_176556 [Auricularia subglabra TFB-10046 SS5]|uniref:F-box domain-containing protein n=1 Tax=Auricularia subglabra (strain TFB-10046 / SS5) TaxID=717982 RepID=J0CVF0_AURST|nr:hypothetical protein AURDEDRAFT_176556 [Auricularia subglabra TFB-10046 SS5]
MAVQIVFGQFGRLVGLLSHELADPEPSARVEIPLLRDLHGFHLGSLDLDGRHPNRYKDMCKQLWMTLLDLTEGPLAGVFLVPVNSNGEWSFRARSMPSKVLVCTTRASDYHDDLASGILHELKEHYEFFRHNRFPVFQKRLMKDLPVELQGYVFEYLSYSDLKSVGRVCKSWHAERQRLEPDRFKYVFKSTRSLVSTVLSERFAGVCPLWDSDYGRQIRDVTYRAERTLADEWHRVQQLVLCDLWEPEYIEGIGSRRLASPDFRSLGLAAGWILPCFSALRRLVLRGISVDDAFFDAAAGLQLQRLSFNRCAILEARAAGASVLLNVHTVDFRLQDHATTESSGFWYLLCRVPAVARLTVSTSRSFQRVDLLEPPNARMHVTLPRLVSVVLIGMHRPSMPGLLEWLTKAAPGVRRLHVYQSLHVRAFVRADAFDALSLFEQLKPWAASLQTLGLDRLSNVTDDALRVLSVAAPDLRCLTIGLMTASAATNVASSLSRFKSLGLFRSDYGSQFTTCRLFQLASKCANLERIALADDTFAVDVSRWRVRHGTAGCFIEPLMLDGENGYWREHPVEDTTWARIRNG